MYIDKFYLFLAAVALIMFFGWIVKKTYYPRAHVERLWREIHGFTKEILDAEDKTFVYDLNEDEIRKRERLIKAILYCYFDKDDEGDKEYVETHMPKSESMELLKRRIGYR